MACYRRLGESAGFDHVYGCEMDLVSGERAREIAKAMGRGGPSAQGPAGLGGLAHGLKAA